MTTSWSSAEREPPAQGAPAYRHTGAALRAALEDVSPPDDEFSQHIAIAVAMLKSGDLGEDQFLTARPSGRHVGPSLT